MISVFFNCSLLELLPDISKWNTCNVTHICGFFYGCSGLKALPDISKWDIKNVVDIIGLFFE